MENIIRVLLMVTMVNLSACSIDSAKRVTYETLHNMKEQQCLRNNLSDCSKRESYDDYELQRNKLNLPSN